MWQKLQPREKILLAVLGVCLVIFAVFYFLLLPQYDTFTKNRQALAELEAKVKAADKVLASERAERDLALKAAEELNEVKSVFNNRMTDGLAVTYIGMEATRTNVRIDSFVPALSSTVLRSVGLVSYQKRLFDISLYRYASWF
jgi:type II secretory pathway component PulM